MRYPISLGVNIDHVATLRQARGTRYPDPVQAALIAEQAGADLITVHLREDKRHIQPRDVELLQQTITTELNLEMAATTEMLTYACQIKPAYCCLVPEKREELTTEGGLEVAGQMSVIKSAIEQLRDAQISTSLFIDPDHKQIEAARECGADNIEIHTGIYADAKASERAQHLEQVISAAQYASQLGLQVHAGHGLHYHNIHAIAQIAEIVEVNIGHSIMARAMMSGMHAAVADMRRLLDIA